MKVFVNKKFTNFKLLILTMAVFVFCFNAQSASAKKYYYKDFEVDIKINEDSSFDVTEKQTYYLDGSFGFLNRDVSLSKIDAITDIEVFDGENKKIQKSELDIGSTSGAKNIQWNFLRRDFSKEEKSWTVKYKVHGGISFLKNYDEIYWNAIPSDRIIPIENVKVTVSLPNNEKFRSDLIRLYAEDIANPIVGSQLDCEPTCTNNYKEISQDSLLLVQQGSEYNSEPADNMVYNSLASFGGYYFNQDNTKAIFTGKNLKPNTNFTIATGFPKEIVSQSAYWKDFLMIYYGYILSLIIFLSCIIIGFVYWYKTEKSREGRRSIIPQYEPPQNLRPAMAEVIVKEKLTNKGLAATIIDLAVRGYVKIEEDKKTKLESMTRYFLLILKLIPFFLFVLIIITIKKTLHSFNFYIVMIFFLFFVLLFLVSFKKRKASNYIITKIKDFKNDPNLEDYEKKYLKALFGPKDYFSTKEIRKDQVKSRALYEKIQKVKDEIYKETELDTGAFEKGLTAEKNIGTVFVILFFLTLFFIGIASAIGAEGGQLLILILVIVISTAGLYAFIKYEARLSDSGIKLKEDWLGFKMYLETAEKHRMQNLKPEFFEKYLPYAMIFGVEKKWAKAFEVMNIPPPSWYGGSAHATTGVSASSASSFSPLSFSNSFSSSFTSAFSSSGAGGASGGGGGAGGGGGGGGGGAG